MDISTRIKEERERRGWTQEELAFKCGYRNKSSISKIESSGDEITSKKVKRIAEALNVSVRYLMGWEDKNSEASKESMTAIANEKFGDEDADFLESLHSRSEMKMLFKTVNGMTKEQIEAIVHMAESFKGGE